MMGPKQKFIAETKEQRAEFIKENIDKVKDTGRYNLSSEFEDVYLRSNIFKAALQKLGKNKVNRILNQKDFKSVVTHVALKFYNLNKNSAALFGFDQEDFISISSVFGLNFYVSNRPKKIAKKDEFYLMMRYISQRFVRLLSDWGPRKFGRIQAYADNPSLDIMENVKVRISMFSKYSDLTNMAFESCPAEEIVIHPEDKLFILFEELQKIENSGIIDISKAQRVRVIKSNIDELKKEILANELEEEISRNKLLSLRGKLDSNIDKYKSDILRYAVSIHVHVDIRKAARKVCRKHKLDFESWAKEQVKSGKLNESDICLRS